MKNETLAIHIPVASLGCFGKEGNPRGIADNYFENRQYDSALYNYERSYPLLPRQTIKSYCRIIKAANELGDSIKAAQYGEMLSDFCLFYHGGYGNYGADCRCRQRFD